MNDAARSLTENRPPDGDPARGDAAYKLAEVEAEAIVAANQRRNFSALSVYQIILRSGWIFKTESIIMPAVLDLISAGQPGVRAMLPLLNRLGQSIPPIFFARRAHVAPLKSRMLLSTTLVMATCFLLLAILWQVTGGRPSWWLPSVFLVCYGLFFAAMGINQLVFSTTQAKLIEVTLRGRLLGYSNVIGAVLAIVCAVLLLPRWLRENTADVASIFGFASGCFFLSAVALLFIVEPAATQEVPRQSLAEQMRAIFRPMHADANFRRLLFVGAMYGASMGLFPHYQSVGLNEVELPLTRLIWWLVVQNIGMGLFSVVAGPLADRFGNRLALRLAMLGLIVAPVLTVVFAWLGPQVGAWYDSVFFCVGITPVAFRTLQNYTLEISKPEEQSHYLSALSLSMASTLVFSPLLGLAMGAWGLAPMFLGVTLMIAAGWIATFALSEPRHKATALPPLDSELV